MCLGYKIQLLLFCMLVFSGSMFMIGTVHAAVDAASTTNATTTQTGPEKVESKPVHDPAAVEKRVREFFGDIPVMVEIARCESKFRQYADSGNVLRGGLGNAMLGVFQFNGPIHVGEALRLGFDVETLEGNIAYARHLYNLEGTDPWRSSYACWRNAEVVETPVSNNTLTDAQRADLLAQLSEILRLIRELQQLLALRYGAGMTI